MCDRDNLMTDLVFIPFHSPMGLFFWLEYFPNESELYFLLYYSKKKMYSFKESMKKFY